MFRTMFAYPAVADMVTVGVSKEIASGKLTAAITISYPAPILANVLAIAQGICRNHELPLVGTNGTYVVTSFKLEKPDEEVISSLHRDLRVPKLALRDRIITTAECEIFEGIHEFLDLYRKEGFFKIHLTAKPSQTGNVVEPLWTVEITEIHDLETIAAAVQS